MGRIVALDYGKKRVGIAVTDPLQMIANGLKTVMVHEVWTFLEGYLGSEKVDALVVGHPLQMNNQLSQSMKYIQPFINRFKKKYPEIPVEMVDERFTSKMAHQTILEGGLKKTARQDKSLVDKISATIILQSYLQQKSLGKR